MADLFDYLIWRGDLDFSQSAFSEVDCLLLCQITYLNFYSLVPHDFSKNGPLLKNVAQNMFKLKDYAQRSDLGPGINPRTMELFIEASKTKRFGSLNMCAFRSITDLEKEEQFCAVTFCSPQWNAVIFRGTDSSIVGWKEDFNLGYLPQVPAQVDACEYLDQAAAELKNQFILGGHSKGGNLALYAATHCKGHHVSRILSIYNNDGPGFSREFFSSERFLSVRDRLNTYVPGLSIVGMLFCHPDEYKVVQSSEKGFGQHDPMSWILDGPGFELIEQRANASKFIGETINEWMDDLSPEEKEEFIETVFGVLSKADITKSAQMSDKPLKSLGKVIGASAKLTSKTRNAVFHVVGELIKTGIGNLRSQ